MPVLKVFICEPCASRLRSILESKGEAAMCEAMGRVLCSTCKKKIPGYDPSAKLVVRQKLRN